MTPGRWPEIEKLYHAALECEPVQREALLAQADPELRREVESLLAQPTDVAHIERPAWEGAESLLQSRVTGLASGAQLGPYRIEGLIGAGGMGEVYRARDTRLGRDVAIKVSAERFSARFQREARAVAALNHPNICTLHDIGPNYLVFELVEGERLKGPLALRKALECAVQIAEGLAAAHAQGITHRDLKPANIMVTRDGRVKILDFGLAKVHARAAGTEGPAHSASVNTAEGMVMGTVGYMSPEQVRGQPADARSDIFSFGVVVHETLTGKRVFSGAASVEVMNAILKEEPEDLPESIPPGLRQIVQHCIEKTPERRFQSAKDLAFALSTLTGSGSQSAVQVKSGPRWRWLMAALGALVVLALTFAAGRWLTYTPAPRAWSAMELGGPEVAMGPRVSPDGHRVAFQAMMGETMQVGMMNPESGDWAALTHDTAHGDVFETRWSPDGSKIFYDRATDVPKGVYSVPVLGGQEQLILEDAWHPEPLPDGSLLVERINPERKFQLYRFWPETGRMQGLPLQTAGLFGSNICPWVAAFPNGREAVVLGSLLDHPTGLHLYIVDLENSHVRQIPLTARDEGGIAGVAVTKDGKSVLAAVEPGNMARIVAIPSDGKSAGRTLLTLTSFSVYLDTTEDGSIYLDQYPILTEIVRFPLSGGPERKIAAFANTLTYSPNGGVPIFLPGGRTIFPLLGGERSHLYALEEGKAPFPLINTAEETAGPVTAVGNSEIAFLIGSAPRHTIALAAVSTGRIGRRILFDKGDITSLAAGTDGKTLYCTAEGHVWAIPLSGGDPKKIRQGDAVVVDPARRSLLVQLTETGRTRLVRVPLDGSQEHELRLDEPYRLHFSPLPSNAIDKSGRLAAVLLTPSIWFARPGLIDLESGKVTQYPGEHRFMYNSVGWADGGDVIAMRVVLRSSIWKFSPETPEK